MKMTAVITGASSGIGAAFARKLAERGYDLVLVARREDRLRELARELNEKHRVKAEPLAADLADPAALEAVAARVEALPDLGLLVNGAGIATKGYFHETPLAEPARLHALHVTAVMRLTHAALASLTRRAIAGTGVINVSSIAAFGIVTRMAGYCSTKAWMNCFTEAVAVELAVSKSPVTVQALCPGLTTTDFWAGLSGVRSTIPDRFWTTPDFVAEESLRGFEQRKLFVIPGGWTKLTAFTLRALPRACIRRIAEAGARRVRRRQSIPI